MLARGLEALLTALLRQVLRLLLPVPDGACAARPPRPAPSVFEAEAFDRCAETRLVPQTNDVEGFAPGNGPARERHG